MPKSWSRSCVASGNTPYQITCTLKNDTNVDFELDRSQICACGVEEHRGFAAAHGKFPVAPPDRIPAGGKGVIRVSSRESTTRPCEATVFYQGGSVKSNPIHFTVSLASASSAKPFFSWLPIHLPPDNTDPSTVSISGLNELGEEYSSLYEAEILNPGHFNLSVVVRGREDAFVEARGHVSSMVRGHAKVPYRGVKKFVKETKDDVVETVAKIAGIVLLTFLVGLFAWRYL